jgi:hypothetical protein
MVFQCFRKDREGFNEAPTLVWRRPLQPVFNSQISLIGDIGTPRELHLREILGTPAAAQRSGWQGLWGPHSYYYAKHRAVKNCP